jgi:dihydrofolate reductase
MIQLEKQGAETALPPVARPLYAIAAMAKNGVIGIGNRLPWRLPEDFKFFKRATTGHVLLMGRKTFESIGRALPNRTTVVLSRQAPPAASFAPPSAAGSLLWVSDWSRALAVEPEKKLFLAGGARLYAEALPLCSVLFLTHVEAEPEGDVFFPDYRQWFDDGEIIEAHPESDPPFTIRRHCRPV